MDKSGLLVEPKFENPEKYLESGEMTQTTEKIFDLSKKAQGKTEGQVLRNLLVLMNENTKRINNPRDERKFKRTAEEILLSGERTGCCDSSTLFVSLARALGIPSMQIITLNSQVAEKSKEKDTIDSGHFFTACYITNVSGEKEWVLIDTDAPVYHMEDARLRKMNLENRNIDNRYFAFAYANDYRDVKCDGIKIDSASNMGIIQKRVYDRTNKDLIEYRSFER